MIRAVVITLTLGLAGCGVETVGTAAVGAAAKAEEARQAQQLQADVQQRLDAALQIEQQRLKDAAEQGR